MDFCFICGNEVPRKKFSRKRSPPTTSGRFEPRQGRQIIARGFSPWKNVHKHPKSRRDDTPLKTNILNQNQSGSFLIIPRILLRNSSFYDVLLGWLCIFE